MYTRSSLCLEEKLFNETRNQIRNHSSNLSNDGTKRRFQIITCIDFQKTRPRRPQLVRLVHLPESCLMIPPAASRDLRWKLLRPAWTSLVCKPWATPHQTLVDLLWKQVGDPKTRLVDAPSSRSLMITHVAGHRRLLTPAILRAQFDHPQLPALLYQLRRR